MLSHQVIAAEAPHPSRNGATLSFLVAVMRPAHNATIKVPQSGLWVKARARRGSYERRCRLVSVGARLGCTSKKFCPCEMDTGPLARRGCQPECQPASDGYSWQTPICPSPKTFRNAEIRPVLHESRCHTWQAVAGRGGVDRTYYADTLCRTHRRQIIPTRYIRYWAYPPVK